MSDDSNPFSRHHQGAGPYDAQPTVAQQNPIPKPDSRGFWTCGIIGGVISVIAVMGLACCGGVGYFAYSMMQEPVAQAVQILEADEEISQRLGSPIESTMSFGEHSYKNNNGNGKAHVEFSATGTKSKASVKADLDLNNGTWSAKKIVVTYPDGESVTLPR